MTSRPSSRVTSNDLAGRDRRPAGQAADDPQVAAGSSTRVSRAAGLAPNAALEDLGSAAEKLPSPADLTKSLSSAVTKSIRSLCCGGSCGAAATEKRSVPRVLPGKRLQQNVPCHPPVVRCPWRWSVGLRRAVAWAKSLARGDRRSAGSLVFYRRLGWREARQGLQARRRAQRVAECKARRGLQIANIIRRFVFQPIDL